MKYLILLIFSLLLFACSNGKKVYWCGDHACINKKEKESYFKKTMIVEIKELSKQNKKNESELEIIKKQAGLEQKKEIKNEKELAKQVRLEEKRRIKEKKELSKQARLEEKREKNSIWKEEKKLPEKVESKTKKKETAINIDTVSTNISSAKFNELVERIIMKNKFRPFPNISDIPN